MLKVLLPLLLIVAPTAASANTSNFTSGSMTQTTTGTQTVTEVIAVERFGGEIKTWNGDNVAATGGDIAGATEFTVVDAGLPWQLEVTTRSAGLIETQDINRTIQLTTTTNTLSVFSQ